MATAVERVVFIRYSHILTPPHSRLVESDIVIVATTVGWGGKRDLLIKTHPLQSELALGSHSVERGIIIVQLRRGGVRMCKYLIKTHPCKPGLSAELFAQKGFAALLQYVLLFMLQCVLHVAASVSCVLQVVNVSYRIDPQPFVRKAQRKGIPLEKGMPSVAFCVRDSQPFVRRSQRKKLLYVALCRWCGTPKSTARRESEPFHRWQHTATHCSTPQYTATHCSTLQHTVAHWVFDVFAWAVSHESIQHTATHCNTLQHTATHCNTLQHTAAHCNTLSFWCL